MRDSCSALGSVARPSRGAPAAELALSAMQRPGRRRASVVAAIATVHSSVERLHFGTSRPSVSWVEPAAKRVKGDDVQQALSLPAARNLTTAALRSQVALI